MRSVAFSALAVLNQEVNATCEVLVSYHFSNHAFVRTPMRMPTSQNSTATWPETILAKARVVLIRCKR